MLCNHVIWLTGLISATVFCKSVQDTEVDPHFFFNEAWFDFAQTFPPKIIGTGVLERECLYKDSVFSTSYKCLAVSHVVPARSQEVTVAFNFVSGCTVLYELQEQTSVQNAKVQMAQIMSW
jgi:enamine deaminase RidA (YjgF/YER057c/UK114 family)